VENISYGELLAHYRLMSKIRLFEQKIDWLFSRGRLGGTCHLCIGQEAVAVGVIANVVRDDYVVSTHRGHGHLIAKGAGLQKIFSEVMGKIDGYCLGKGGTQHLCAKDIGFYGTNGITGGGIPIATGIALSVKLRRTEQIVVSFFGDGATNQGTFHESLNMASIWDLPILYVCENNLYGMSTHIKDVTNIDNLSERARAYNIKSYSADGMDLLDVLDVANKAVRYVRNKKKPCFIEAQTYRFCGHSKSDARSYRTKDEETHWRKKDCIGLLRDKILSKRITAEKLEKVDIEVESEIEEALMRSEQGPETPESFALEGIYSNG